MFFTNQTVSTIIVKIVRGHSKTEKLQSRQDTGRVKCVSHEGAFMYDHLARGPWIGRKTYTI